MEKEEKRIYDKEYYKKNKEKKSMRQKERYRKDKEKMIKYSLKYNKEYRKLEDVRKKNNVRKQTIRKFGKLPKGKQYHHNTEPYEFDKFEIILEREHRSFGRDKIKRRGIKIRWD